MGVRRLKLSFRRKPLAAVAKVYVTVRLPDQRAPRQLHLGYLPASRPISSYARRRLARRLRQQWRELFGSRAVAIDWTASAKKWSQWHQPSKPSLDRAAAREQLRCWQSGADEVLLPRFGGPGSQTSELAGEEFHRRLLDSHQGILKRLNGRAVDPAEVANWWEDHEIPRLLCCFHRLTIRRPTLRFGRAGFLRYLAGNISRGFAAAQFLREHPNRPIDPETLLDEWS